MGGGRIVGRGRRFAVVKTRPTTSELGGRQVEVGRMGDQLSLKCTAIDVDVALI